MPVIGAGPHVAAVINQQAADMAVYTVLEKAYVKQVAIFRQAKQMILDALDEQTKLIIFPDTDLLRAMNAAAVISQAKIHFAHISMEDVNSEIRVLQKRFQGSDNASWRKHVASHLEAHATLNAIGNPISAQDKVRHFIDSLTGCPAHAYFHMHTSSYMATHLNAAAANFGHLLMAYEPTVSILATLVPANDNNYVNAAAAANPHQQEKKFYCHTHGPNISHKSDACLNKPDEHNDGFTNPKEGLNARDFKRRQAKRGKAKA